MHVCHQDHNLRETLIVTWPGQTSMFVPNTQGHEHTLALMSFLSHICIMGSHTSGTLMSITISTILQQAYKLLQFQLKLHNIISWWRLKKSKLGWKMVSLCFFKDLVIPQLLSHAILLSVYNIYYLFFLKNI